MWDKRMWDDDGSWLQAPTLRTVTEIAVTVASGIVSTGAGSLLMASVQTAGIGLAKDVFFSSIDFAGGYIDSSQFGTQLGTSILSAGVNVAVGAAFNGVGNIDKATGIAELGGLKAVVGKEAMGNMFVKAGMSMAQTYTAGVASSFVAAIVSDDYWGTVGEAAWSTGTLANVVSAGAGSLAGDALNKLNEVTVNTHAGFSFENKINAGDFANFAGSLAGAGAGYAIGGEMTLNVLNLKDLSGGELGSTGLLELRLGKDGTAMNLGTGGVDVSLGTVGNALAGAAVLGTNGLVSLYEAVTGRKDIGETLRSQYGYGGIEEKLQLFGIVTGLTGLELAEKGEFTAETTRDGFRKTVTLNGYRKGMSVEEQLQMGVLLSQEAYRDGVVTEDNYLETRGAVLGHTEMAARMRDAGYDFSGNAVIAADLAAYDYARSVGDMSLMDLYADLAYRSDGDYFDLKKFFKRVIEGLIEDNLNGDTPSRGTASAFGVLSTYTGFAGDIADEAGAAKLLGRTSIVTGLASLIMKGIEAAHNPTVDNIKGLPGDAASVVFGAIGGTAFGILGGVSISFYVDAGLFLTKNVAKLEYMLKHHPMEAMQGIYNYSVNYSGRNGEK
jgi:hypothetical protein